MLNEVKLKFLKKLIGWDEEEGVDLAAEGIRFIRVLPVEFFDEAASQNVCKGFP